MKAIVIKATGAKVQFGQTAAETHRILENAGVVISKTTVKLIQNGTKTSACGVEVVVEEKQEKIKKGRKGVMINDIINKHPEIKKLIEAGFKPFGVETKHMTRACFKCEDSESYSINIGKRGVNLRNLKNRETKVFAQVADAVEYLLS